MDIADWAGWPSLRIALKIEDGNQHGKRAHAAEGNPDARLEELPGAPSATAALDQLEGWGIRHSSWLALGIIVAALAIRIASSTACFLNPDEALHSMTAEADSWLGTWKAALGLAHPPLFILVLHAFLFLGRSEVILRLPSICGGTAALWLAFVWLRRALGAVPALAGLLFMAVSPAAISASTEVRQYGLLLCFLCGALYATERALAEHSTRWTIAQGLFLLGALLTHYTAPVAIFSIDLYILIRFLQKDIPQRIFFTFAAIQLVLAAVLAWLYFEQVRRSAVFSPAGLFYLHQYFYDRATETLLGFSRRAVVGTFAHMISRKWATLSMLVFLGGLCALTIGRTKAPRLMALLILAPFIVGFATAVYHVFPFTGSRHQTYLLPFLAAGFSAAFTWIPRRLALPVLLAAAAIAPYWVSHNPPDNDPRLFAIGYMTAAIDYIKQTIPPTAPLFVDDESRLVVEYYLERNDRDPKPSNGFIQNDEGSNGYRLVETKSHVWAFSPNDVLQQVRESADNSAVSLKDPLHVVSVGWSYHTPLASQLPASSLRSSKTFGTISVLAIPPG
jgi:hypothetical protein